MAITASQATGPGGTRYGPQLDYELLVLNAIRGSAVVPGELRRSGKQTPVLFLTAGTDPCLPKPFGFSDFLTRVRSALGCAWTGQAGRLSIADLEVDLVQHRAIRGGRRPDMTPKEFLLLSLLAHAGEVQSRAVIADQVWGINVESNTNFVDVHIRRLRSKADDPFDAKLIHTVRGSGCVLEERN